MRASFVSLERPLDLALYGTVRDNSRSFFCIPFSNSTWNMTHAGIYRELRTARKMMLAVLRR